MGRDGKWSFSACAVVIASVFVAACGAAPGEGDGQSRDAITVTPPPPHTPVPHVMTFHPEGVIVERHDGSCPRLVVDRVVVRGMTEADYVTALMEIYSPMSNVWDYLPQIFGPSYPGSLRPSPLYCVYDVGDRNFVSSPVPVADAMAAAKAQCGGACSYSTLEFLDWTTQPGGHGCTTCQ